MNTIKCTQCNIEKGIADFHTRTVRGKLGYYAKCKTCKNGNCAEHYKKNQEKLKTKQRKYYKENLEKCKEVRKKHYKENTPQCLDIQKSYFLKEGHGTYMAIYPSGIYIGSGQLTSRRNAHINGNASIAKKLNEKAAEFHIMKKCNKSECLKEEQKLIDGYGIELFLNSVNPNGSTL